MCARRNRWRHTQIRATLRPMQDAAYAEVIAWDDRGLAPAVVQHAITGETLMVAWMNHEALRRTRATGLVHFYSRSRKTLWQKGETSGNTLTVRELRTDCDRDAILVRAEPAGPTCHTGARSCFHRLLDEAASGDDPSAPREVEDQGPGGAPAAVVDLIYGVLEARRDSAEANSSYTASLLAKGFPKILAKIAEEHGELAAELPAGDRQSVVHETADLLFHVLVGLVARGIAPAEVWRELERRFGVSGHEEKAAREAAAAPSGA
jgi:phosphoribosyl-AMP cyclohydrolase / phosphoribosyl-ATP pyrophosphohydrolase